MKRVKLSEKRLSLSAPAQQLVSKLREFFSWDADEVSVGDYDTASQSITVTVGDSAVLVALEKYLKPTLQAGTTPVSIVVKAANADVEAGKAEVSFADFEEEVDTLFKDVFAYLGVETVEDDDGTVIGTYVLFRDDTLLQFYADDLSNPYGVKTVVPADVAREIVDLRGSASITTDYTPRA